MTVFDSDALFGEAIQRLRDATHQDRSFDAAKMQLINLPEIIRNAGPHWPLVKDKIRIGSLNFLKGCLAEDDIVLPAGDGFLIIFNDGDSAQLQARAQDLRALLLEFYLGQETLNKLKLEVQSQTLRADQLHTLLAPAPQPASEPTTLTCVFAPVWTSRANVIGSYLCVPVHYDSGEPRFGYDAGYLMSGQFSHRDYCELDLNLLDLIEAAFDRYSVDDVQPALGAQVHCTTLASRSARSTYLERLSKVPAHKLKYMYVRIAEIEPGTPMINLADWAGMLRARVRNVQLEFHYSQAPPAMLNDLGVFGAGFQMPAGFNRDSADPAAAVTMLQHWGATLGRQRKALFVDQIRRADLVHAAARAGAGFITSDVFWQYAKWPGAVLSAPPPPLRRGGAAA